MNAGGETTRLDEAAARSLIARRLRVLDHPPDHVSPEALDLLVRHGGGTGARLRTGLASALFLASTEDAPRVDEAIAARALAETPHAGSRAGRRVPWAAVLGTTLALGGALAAFLAATRADPPTLIAGAHLIHLAAPLATPAPVTVRGPEALPPLPPDVAVRTMPVPPNAQPLPLPAPSPSPAPAATASTSARALPAAASPTIVLLFPARRPHALDQLGPLAQALLRAGITDVRTLAVAGLPTRRAVSYFYTDDAKLAQLIADTIASAHWGTADRNSLRPSLVLIPSGLPPHTPGEVDVQLP